MISFDVLIARTSGLQPDDLERWISNHWVRPDGVAGHYLFHDIDVARARLIFELRDDLEVNEAALPVVLSLLDQLYDARRRMQDLGDALGELAPVPLRRALAERLARAGSARFA